MISVTRIFQPWVLILLLMAASRTQAALSLPAPILPPNPGFNALQFGDFTVYSLEFLNYSPIYNPDGTNGGNPFDVDSSPGKLQSLIVIGSSPASAVNNQDLINAANGIDDAEDLPNNINVGEASFRNDTNVVDPAGSFAGDSLQSWDAKTSVFQANIAAGDKVVFFFNLNETGDSGSLSGQDMLSWAKVTLENTQTGAKVDFYLTGNGYLDGGTAGKALSMLNGMPDPTALPGTGDPNLLNNDPLQPNPQLDPSIDPRWAYIHGRITVDENGVFQHFGPKDSNNDPSGWQEVDQNLGANQAAFAIYNKQLSDAILDPLSGYDTVHIQYAMSRMVNGFEQIFVMGAQIPNPPIIQAVPEPASLALWTLLSGCASLAAIRRRKIA